MIIIKRISLILAVLIAALAFAACGGDGKVDSKPDASTADSGASSAVSLPADSGAESNTGDVSQDIPTSADEGSIFGVWEGKNDVEYDEDEMISYTYTLTLDENGSGTLLEVWDQNDAAHRYTYTVTANGNSLRIKGKQYTKNGTEVEIADFVEFTVDAALAGGKLTLGEAYDYDTVNYDMSDVFPLTLERK